MWQRTFQKEREALAKAKGKKVKVSVAQLCLILFDPMDWSPLGSSVHGFSRQEYCRGLPFPFLGDLSDPGLNMGLLHCTQILYGLSHQGRKLWPL